MKSYRILQYVLVFRFWVVERLNVNAITCLIFPLSFLLHVKFKSIFMIIMCYYIIVFSILVDH